MGIYIPNMEMPKNCTFCEMWHNIDCHPYQGISPPKSRPDHCPLISVPPHGRLIDADAFERLECDICDGACESLPCDCTNCNSEYRCDFMLDIHSMPTIIPADGGE